MPEPPKRKWWKRIPPFFRIMLIVLGAVVCLSFAGDELFLKAMDGTEASTTTKPKPHQKPEAQSSSTTPVPGASPEINASASPAPVSTTYEESSLIESPKPGLHTRIWNSLTSKTNNLTYHQPRISLVIDYLEESYSAEQDVARLTFARMLELTANAEYGIATQIVVVVNLTQSEDLFPCFPNVHKHITVVSDSAHWMDRQLEQQEWLGEHALEATRDGWKEALKQLSKERISPQARYAGDVSLPFIRIHETSIPNIMDYHSVSQLLDFVALKSDCCTITATVDNETVVYLDQDSPLQPRQLLMLLKQHRTNGSHVVLLGDQEANFADHFVPLLKREGFLVHSGVAKSPKSMTPYCILMKASFEVLGSTTSPLSSWAALANAKAAIRRLVVPNSIPLPEAYPEKDPRSSISFESIPEHGPSTLAPTVQQAIVPKMIPNVTTAVTLEEAATLAEVSKLDMVVELPTYDPLLIIAEALALQFQLSSVLGVPTNIVWRHGEERWMRHVSRVKKCYPPLSELDFEVGNSQLWEHKLIHEPSNRMAIESNTTISNMTLMSQLVPIARRWNDFRQTALGGPSANNTPYILVRKMIKADVTDDFRPTFNRLFKFDDKDSDCRELGAMARLERPQTVWDYLTNTPSDLTPSSNSSAYDMEATNTSIRIPGESQVRLLNPGMPGHTKRPMTIVIELSGEMCNQLAKLAFGYGLKWLLEEDYNITARPILRHQRHTKWKTARRSVVLCFPNFEYANFEEGNTEEFDERSRQLNHWLGNDRKERLFFNSLGEDSVREKVRFLVDGILTNSSLPPSNTSTFGADITLPFITVDDFGMKDFLVDRYYDRLRDLFRFNYDSPSCCSEKVLPDETAVHIREFRREMPKKYAKFGFIELSPNKTANTLLSNLAAGDKVVVVSRFPQFMTEYTESMHRRGLIARNADKGTGEQSFCFLLSARKEFIGNAQSTYAAWAALLGNATKARLYSVKSPARARRFTYDGSFFHYNFTHPTLRARIQYEFISTEEQDELERSGKLLLSNGSLAKRRH